MKSFLKKLAQYSWGILLFAILFTAAGVCLIAFPEDALPQTIIAISVFTMVFAIALVVVALAGRKRDVKFFFLLLGALCSLFAGIFLLIKRNDGAIEVLSLFVGLMVIIDGSFKLHTAVMSKRYKLWLWWVMLVLSLLSIGGGLYLIKWPTIDRIKLVSVLMGLIMIVDGLQNLLTTFYTPMIEKRVKDEAVSESEEEKAELVAKEMRNAEKASKRKHRKSREQSANIDEVVDNVAENVKEETAEVDVADVTVCSDDAVLTECVNVGDDNDDLVSEEDVVDGGPNGEEDNVSVESVDCDENKNVLVLEDEQNAD